MDYQALDTMEDKDDVLALDWPGLDALLRDPHHSLLPQDIVSRFYCLPVFAGLQVLEVLASGNKVSLGRIAPGHILNNAKVGRVVVSVRRSFQVRDMEVPVLI